MLASLSLRRLAEQKRFASTEGACYRTGCRPIPLRSSYGSHGSAIIGAPRSGCRRTSLSTGRSAILHQLHSSTNSTGPMEILHSVVPSQDHGDALGVATIRKGKIK